MKYILVILIAIIIGICIYYVYKRKATNKNLKKEDKMILVNKNSSNNKIAIKVEELPIETIENCESMFEITDNKILGHIDNLVPGLIQVGTATNNAIQANANIVYQAIIPAGATLTNSANMSNAVRGIYHGTNGIKGHANFVAVNQTERVVSNTISSGISVTSMIVGQYYMIQINSELTKINEEISKISSFQDNEYKSKILALVIQIKRISSFQTEIMENQQLRNLDIDKLNHLEQNCIELLGQANLTITEFTKKDDLDYKKYNKELTEIHNWYTYQKTLLEMLYKITDLKNILYIGAISKEQLNIIPTTYTKQVMEVHELLTRWHERITKKLGIDTVTSRRKRMGFDGIVHWIPGLFKDDFNFCAISEKTKTMIAEQTSNYNVTSRDKDNLFDKDVKIISKDGKIYYLP